MPVDPTLTVRSLARGAPVQAMKKAPVMKRSPRVSETRMGMCEDHMRKAAGMPILNPHSGSDALVFRCYPFHGNWRLQGKQLD